MNDRTLQPEPALDVEPALPGIKLLAIVVLAPVLGEAGLRLVAVPALLYQWQQVLARSLLAAAIWVPLSLGLWYGASFAHLVNLRSMRLATMIALAMFATLAEAMWSRWVYDAAGRDTIDWWLARGIPELFTAIAVLFAHTAHTQLVGIRAASSRLHRSRMALRTAELHRLDRQLQPHFLYNTLNTIAETIHRDPTLAERLVSTTRDLFNGMGTREVDERSVREEVESLRPYLELQQARFDRRLSVFIHVPMSLEHYVVPTLILQPLVENAIRHGVERATTGARIWLAVTKDGDQLDVSVRNDVPVQSQRPGFRREGIGLRNARERLACLYGNAAQLRFAITHDGRALANLRLPAKSSTNIAFADRHLSENGSAEFAMAGGAEELYRRAKSLWRAIGLGIVVWCTLFSGSIVWSAFVAWKTGRALGDVAGPPSNLFVEFALCVVFTALAILSTEATFATDISSNKLLAAQVLVTTACIVSFALIIADMPGGRMAKLSAVNTLAARASVLSAILVAVTSWRWYVDQLAVLTRTELLERARLFKARNIPNGLNAPELSARLAEIAQLVRVSPASADASVVELAESLRAALKPTHHPQPQHV